MLISARLRAGFWLSTVNVGIDTASGLELGRQPLGTDAYVASLYRVTLSYLD